MGDQRIQTTFRVDPELLKSFRHALLERETKMTPVIEKLIREWLHGYEFKSGHHGQAPTQSVAALQSEAIQSTVVPATPGALFSPATETVASLGTPVSSTPPNPNPWLRILGMLEKKISRHSYDTWLKPTRYSHTSAGILFVRVPSAEFRHIGDKYADLIQEALVNLGLEYQTVQFITPEDDSAALLAGGPPEVSPALGPHSAATRLNWGGAALLNPRYTFDTFVIGASNQFAHAACRAVAEHPSKTYNPLFLCGGVGMGKTHLMNAIGHEIKKRKPESVICYISSEKFTNEMINSLRYDKMSSFRDKFRNVDVLLIDDIQFLAQKERTQEEFFHTFNALHESMKQIVIASDRPPKELAEVEDRLRSRFEWGLIADIQPPDLETKVAILQKKAEQEKVTLPTDVALYIASNIRSNIRELEGAVIRLVAHASLDGAEITLPYTQQVLRNFVDPQGRRITIELIQKTVAQQFGLRVGEIKAKSNVRAIVYPRQIAMYLARHLTEASPPEIGRQFGGKHHTTVLHSVEKIDILRRTDKDLEKFINKVTEHLGG